MIAASQLVADRFTRTATLNTLKMSGWKGHVTEETFREEESLSLHHHKIANRGLRRQPSLLPRLRVKAS